MKYLKVLLTLIVVGLTSSPLLEAADNSGGNVPNELVILRPRFV